MTISLGERSPETVAIYHEKSDCARVREALPQKARTLEEALEDYRASLRPGAASYGRTILIDGRYAGDVWCYGIDPGAEPEAMLACMKGDKKARAGVVRFVLPRDVGDWTLVDVSDDVLLEHLSAWRGSK